jgi:peroxiredoxin Q/BCP
VVIGISTDKLTDCEKFMKKEKLNFALFADTDKKISKAYGVLGDKGYARRTTFVIDKKGVLRKVYTKVDPDKHPAEVLDFIKEELAK